MGKYSESDERTLDRVDGSYKKKQKKVVTSAEEFKNKSETIDDHKSKGKADKGLNVCIDNENHIKIKDTKNKDIQNVAEIDAKVEMG